MHALLLAVLLVQAPVPPTADRGVVAGKVLGMDGRPAEGIRVTAMVSAEGASTNVAHASITQTDRDGQYRLENIPPGRYYITAGLVDLPTYYPGTLTTQTASAVSVAAGSTTIGIDFTMLRGTGGKITGRLAVLPTLKRSAPGVLAISSPAVNLTSFPRVYLQTTLREDGTFEFPKVPPGTYNLRMSIGTITGMDIVVGDTDVRVVLAGEPAGVRILGKIVMPGAAPGAPLPSTPVFLASGTSGPPSFSNETNDDGTFEFLRVPPGTYSLYTRANPGERRSLTVTDKDITGIELGVPIKK